MAPQEQSVMMNSVRTCLGVASSSLVLVLAVVVLDFPVHEILSRDDTHNAVVLIGCPAAHGREQETRPVSLSQLASG
jgi:hypothetical protein